MSADRTKSSNPHDALFKRTFSDVKNARAELSAVLPKAIVEGLDWPTLEVVPGSFVDELYSETHSDLLYKVRLRRREALVYLLFEHQSTVDEFIALRLLGYIVRILEQFRKSSARGLPLPVVLPVVLHHSDSGWTAPTDFQSLFDQDLLEIESIRGLVPQFRFVLDDISRVSDEELMRRALTGSAQIVPVVLWAMRDGRRAEAIGQALTAWLEALRRIFRTQSGRDALIEVFRYLSWVNERLRPQDLITVAAEIGPDAKDAIMTLAEQWIAEGEAKGEAKGRAEGRAEGERRLLEKQLRLKFGEIPERALKRLAGAEEPELTRWAERVLSASSLEEALA